MKKNPTRILLIEDDPGDARLVQEALTEAGAARFKLDWAENLASGLKTLQADPADVVLLDLNLPDSTGINTFTKVHARFPQMPLILLTGQDDQELAAKTVQEGAEDFIVKGQVDGSLLARSIRYAIERTRTKNELVESERKYRNLFENAVLGVFTVTLDGKPISVNPEFVRMFGYASIEEFLDKVKDSAEIFEDPKRRADILQLKTANPDLTTFENLYRRKNGSTFWGNLTMRQITTADGQSAFLEGLIEDISVRKRMEQALFLMSDTQRQIVQLENVQEIFQLVGKKVQELIIDGYVSITVLDEQIQAMKVVGLYGFDVLYEKLVGKFKVDVSKVVVPLADMTEDELGKFRSGCLEKFAGGLYKLSFQKVPKRICAAAEKELGLKGIYTMGFAWQNLHFGGITILAKSDLSPYKEMIETIVHQATIAIKRLQSEEALHKTKDYWQSLVENTSDLVTIVDANAVILYQNPAVEHVLGYTPDEVIGKNAAELFHPEDWSPAWDTLAATQVKPGSMPPMIEIRLCCKDGSWRRMEMTGVVRTDETGRIVSVLNSRDITERKRAEERLRESEEHFRGAIAAAGLVPYGIDYETKRFTFMGENIFMLTGYTAEEFTPAILKESLLESRVWGLENAGITQDEASERFRSGEIKQWDNDLHIRTRNGDERWIGDVSVPLSDKSGRVTSAIGIFQDLTDRKQAEEALRESEEQFRTFALSAHDAILTIDDQANIIFWNAAAEKMFGYSAEEAFGKSFAITIPVHLRESIEAGFRRVITSGNSDLAGGVEETFRLRKDGSQFPAEVVLSSYEIKGNRFVTATIHDITKRKQVEISLRENQARLDLALQSASMGVWTWNIAEDRHNFDEQTCRLLGINQDVYTGAAKEFFSVVHPDDREDVKAALARSMTEDVPYDPEYRVIWPDKSLHYITARGMLIRDEAGQPARINGLTWDITGNKLAELELARQTEELSRLYRASTSLLTDTPFDLLGLAQTIIKIVLDEFGQSNCSLFLVENDSNKLTRIAVVGPYAEQVSKVRFTVDGPGQVPNSIRSGNCINTRDVRTNPAYVAAWDMARSELTIPLKVGNRVIGAIDVQSALAGFFSADDERLMLIFAERAALALEHARLYTQTERRLENLTALRIIDTAIASSFDIRFTLGILLDQVSKQLGIETANIMIFDPITQTVQSSVTQGFHTNRLGQASLHLGQSLSRQVIRERRTIAIEDLTNNAEGISGTADLVSAGITAYLGVPLVAKGVIKGVLEIYQGKPISLDQDQRSFLDMLAGQAAIAIDSAQLFENLQGSNVELMMAYDETIEGWSQAMDLRDKETEGHSRRVTEMTVKLASSFGSSPEDLIHIRRGALLHDIGKLGVPDEILRKPGPLTDEEWVIMRKHPQAAYDMLAPITYLHTALDIPFCHHEKWDGSGYPRGLKGNQIPLAARIFAVADVWDALTSDRPYRGAWSREKTFAFIQEQSGIQFDPGVVSVFIRELPEPR